VKQAVLLAVLLAGTAVAAWELRAPLPEPRYSGSAAVIGSCIYYVGGSAVGGAKTRTVFIYDTEADSWSRGDSMNIARHRFGAAALDGRIFAYGGWGNGGVLLNSTERYDTATRAWTMLETLPAGRASMFAGAADGRVLCMGGWDGTQAHYECWEYGWNGWSAVMYMPLQRCEGMCTSDRYYLYCFGGTEDGSTPVGEQLIYDRAFDEWYSQWPPLPTPRAGGAAATDGRQVWVMGGITASNQTTAVNERMRYPQGWYTDEPLPEPLRYLAACYVPSDTVHNFGYFYVMGGLDSLLQPSARVYRWEVPLTVEERSVPNARHPAATTIGRGTRLDSPLGQNASGDVVGTDGCIKAKVTAGDACPDLAAGTYLVRWRRADETALTRVVVVR
jgi:hypothetical protein